jgi:hypothetical protein
MLYYAESSQNVFAQDVPDLVAALKRALEFVPPPVQREIAKLLRVKES